MRETSSEQDDNAIEESFPASDPPAEDHDGEAGKPEAAPRPG